MNAVLCITMRFLDPMPQYHGRGNGDELEWPPSPLRLFQAMAAAAQQKWKDRDFENLAEPPLEWLEHIRPSIVAPKVLSDSSGYRTYVPNNTGDLMMWAWQEGDSSASMAKFRVEKDVRSTKLANETIHFLYPLSHEQCPYFQIIREIARSVTHLGWGIDMVAGNAELLNTVDVSTLSGELWNEVLDPSATALRIPVEGTLRALLQKHQYFLKRISEGHFTPVPPLSRFRLVHYRRATDPSSPIFAAFRLLRSDADAPVSFDPVRKTFAVSDMIRHTVVTTAQNQGWSEEKINVLIRGKTPDGSGPLRDEKIPDRFQFLPLPTINHPLNRVEAIRRFLISAPAHCDQHVAWVRRTMTGEISNDDHGNMVLLAPVPESDWVLRQYIEPSRSWSTVTPVVLPGFDDPDHLRRKLKQGLDSETQKQYLARLSERMYRLLCKAFQQAGFSPELIDQSVLDWRNVGFRSGVQLASQYLLPESLRRLPRIHVRVQFPHPVQGPICIGSGRFRGYGLFAKDLDR